MAERWSNKMAEYDTKPATKKTRLKTRAWKKILIYPIFIEINTSFSARMLKGKKRSSSKG